MTRNEAYNLGVSFSAGEDVEMSDAMPKIINDMFADAFNSMDMNGMKLANALGRRFAQGRDWKIGQMMLEKTKAAA